MVARRFDEHMFIYGVSLICIIDLMTFVLDLNKLLRRFYPGFLSNTILDMKV